MVIIYAEENYEIKLELSKQDFDPKEEPQAINCPIKL